MHYFLTLLCFATTLQAADEPPTLPKEWLGNWEGKLVIQKPEGKKAEVYAALAVHPLESGKGYTWQITYGEGDKKQVRKYELVPGKNLGYEIDEKNGIRITAVRFDNTITTLFKVGDTLLQTRYELKDETLTLETTSFDAKNTKTDGPVSIAAGIKVTSYTATDRQVAVMKQVKAK